MSDSSTTLETPGIHHAPIAVASAGTRAGSATVQPILEVINAVHVYDDFVALDNVTITAAPGEFLTIRAQSGSGKTTLLRLISALEKPYKIGALRLNGVDVSNVPAFLRNCTTVFQNYALFPHMSVGENVEYGLKVRGVASAERRARAMETLKLVRLGDKYERRIHQLSGGERQRVALAPALLPRPAILLLDEPLGPLDEKLRVDMQVELLEIHKRLGMTFVYITHSQEEALTMSDHIILMRQGRIEQSGSPTAIFDRPVSRFAASFMGVENQFDGELVSLDGEEALVRVGSALLSGRWSGRSQPRIGGQVAVGVRAERLRIASQAPSAAPGLNVLAGHFGSAIYKGKYLDRTVITEIGPMKVRLWDSSSTDGQGFVWWKKEDCMVMNT